MATPITYTNIPVQNIMTPSSRYKGQNVIYYAEQNFLTFDTYIRRPYKATGSEKVMVLSKGVEYRPDLVSQDYYGFPDNWWRIMEANGMADIMEFRAGVTVVLPELTL